MIVCKREKAFQALEPSRKPGEIIHSERGQAAVSTGGKPDGLVGTNGLAGLFTLDYWSLSLVWWETMRNVEVRRG